MTQTPEQPDVRAGDPTGTAADPATPPVRCPPFNPADLRGKVALDNAARWLVLVAVVGFLVAGSALDRAGQGHWSTLLLAGLAGLWIWLSIRSARVTQSLGQIGAVMEQDPAAAEALIAQGLRRWPLQRPVRLMLYHRLAVLRHRQQRFGEAAAISQAVLMYPYPALDGLRAHLLLMLVESRLQAGDLWGAYQGLAPLHGMSLGLVESLQRLALQTRYDLAAGHDAAAVEQLDHKVELAELMPAPQSGAMHAMLALAAERLGQSAAAAWLRRRAELLCTPEQLQRLTGTIFAEQA